MYKVRIMISIFQGWPRKILESYTFVAGFLICQYTFQYTSCILCVTGGILGGTWKVCIRNCSVVAGNLTCQYTFQYTSCILRVTGGILGDRRNTGRHVEGVYKEFYSCGRLPSSSGHMSVYIMYTGRIMGYFECGVEGMHTNLKFRGGGADILEVAFLAVNQINHIR